MDKFVQNNITSSIYQNCKEEKTYPNQSDALQTTVFVVFKILHFWRFENWIKELDEFPPNYQRLSITVETKPAPGESHPEEEEVIVGEEHEEDDHDNDNENDDDDDEDNDSKKKSQS